jgi:hypothetical protein
MKLYVAYSNSFLRGGHTFNGGPGGCSGGQNRVDHKVGHFFFFFKSQIFKLCDYFALLKYFF